MFDIFISSVIKLAVTMDYSKDGRVIYSNDQYKLQYVTSSTEWDTPHWQVNDPYSFILPDITTHFHDLPIWYIFSARLVIVD